MKDHSALYKEVGAKIRSQRETRGPKLSQEALAATVGLKRTSISNIEKGRQKLLLHTFVDIAAALDVEPAALLPGKPAPPASPVVEEALDRLVKSESERDFIGSAIGFITQKGTHHGNQEKENSGAGTDAAGGRRHQDGPRARVGNRARERGKNRR